MTTKKSTENQQKRSCPKRRGAIDPEKRTGISRPTETLGRRQETGHVTEEEGTGLATEDETGLAIEDETGLATEEAGTGLATEDETGLAIEEAGTGLATEKGTRTGHGLKGKEEGTDRARGGAATGVWQ
jgi:hypothetical protein